MRIAIDARYLGVSNSALARYSENLLQALARVDEDNEYIVYVSASLKRKLRLGDNFRLVPLRGLPASFSGMRRISVAVRRERPDLLHVHFPLAPPLCDCPLLLTVHDLLPFTPDPMQLRTWRKPLRWFWAYMLYPMSLRCARWVICVSDATRLALSRMFPDMYQNSFVIHSGVSESYRTPVEPATLELIRTRLNLRRPYILYSGSARAEKNVIGMLRVFALLRQRHPELEHYSFVLEIPEGNFSLSPVYKTVQQFGLTESVRVLRKVGEEERRVLFEDASVFMIFSRNEGFCMPVLEAQLTGLPVICADAGALPEVAGEEGAVYIDPANESDTVEMVHRVLTNETLRAYLKNKGRQNAQRFDWTETAENILKVYELLYYPREQVRNPADHRMLLKVFEWLRL